MATGRQEGARGFREAACDKLSSINPAGQARGTTAACLVPLLVLLLPVPSIELVVELTLPEAQRRLQAMFVRKSRTPLSSTAELPRRSQSEAGNLKELAGASLFLRVVVSSLVKRDGNGTRARKGNHTGHDLAMCVPIFVILPERQHVLGQLQLLVLHIGKV